MCDLALEMLAETKKVMELGPAPSKLNVTYSTKMFLFYAGEAWIEELRDDPDKERVKWVIDGVKNWLYEVARVQIRISGWQATK